MIDSTCHPWFTSPKFIFHPSRIITQCFSHPMEGRTITHNEKWLETERSQANAKRQSDTRRPHWDGVSRRGWLEPPENGLRVRVTMWLTEKGMRGPECQVTLSYSLWIISSKCYLHIPCEKVSVFSFIFTHILPILKEPGVCILRLPTHQTINKFSAFSKSVPFLQFLSKT